MSNTKSQILDLLSANKGQFFSGEELASTLNVSRNAVWKAVTSLRLEGYSIEAIKNKGYALSADTDVISVNGIKDNLKFDLPIEVYKEVTSTNTLIREAATAGASEGLTIIANKQTKGRGRIGRTFHSPADTGIYMSILLRPKCLKPEDAVKITTLAAVAACEAIEEVSGKNAAIKWVNDIFMNGLKVCGILTEGAMSLENGNLDYAILGIGFNAYEPEGGFEDDIKGIAGSIFDKKQADAKNKLIASFLNKFMEGYLTDNLNNYVERYKEKSFVIGLDVNVISPISTRPARAIDIDEQCRLVVEFEDGTIEHLASGEISVRPR